MASPQKDPRRAIAWIERIEALSGAGALSSWEADFLSDLKSRLEARGTGLSEENAQGEEILSPKQIAKLKEIEKALKLGDRGGAGGVAEAPVVRDGAAQPAIDPPAPRLRVIEGGAKD